MQDIKKIRIGLYTDGFINWQGGIDFLKYVLLGLNNDARFSITLLIPDRNNLKIQIINALKIILNNLLKTKYKQIAYAKVEETAKNLSSYLEVESFLIYNKQKELIKEIEGKFDVILPVFYPKKNLGVNAIYYLYDFQFKYFPQYFSVREISERNAHIQNHIKHSRHIIVNAIEVKKDIEKFTGRNNNIHVLPFTPIFDENSFINKDEDFKEVADQFEVEKNKYFIVSNQFWQHKGHKTAIEALLILKKEYGANLKLLCTGRFPDLKNQLYCDELKYYVEQNNLAQDVIFTGFIDKHLQLKLLLNSAALIQPTQFEGGPGGFSVYEALGYYHPCIISDISVNKEIPVSYSNIQYFKVQDSADLAEKMENALSLNNHESVNLEILRFKFLENTERFRLFWSNLLEDIVAES